MSITNIGFYTPSMENGIVAEMFVKKCKFDNGFNYVLFYINQQTNYILLRPIMTINVHEMAVELLKIFADFDTPKLLKVVPSMKPKITEIMKIMKNMNLPFQLPEVCIDRRRNPYYTVTSYLNELSMHWALEIGLIQWTTNIILDTYGSKPKFNSTLSALYNPHFEDQWQIDTPTCQKYGINSFENTKMVHKPKLVTTFDLKCSKCHLPLYKVYKCHKCKKSYHFTCCYRELVQIEGDNKIITTCPTCKIIGHMITKCSV